MKDLRAVVAWIEILTKLSIDNPTHDVTGVLVSILALRILFGIRIYDQRNDELYNDLVSRGRKIEDELGCTRAFSGGAYWQIRPISSSLAK